MSDEAGKPHRRRDEEKSRWRGENGIPPSASHWLLCMQIAEDRKPPAQRASIWALKLAMCGLQQGGRTRES